jgi:hypothetical protein
VAVQEQSFASVFVSTACHSAASPHIIVPVMWDLPYRQQSGVAFFPLRQSSRAGSWLIVFTSENCYIINEAQINLVLYLSVSDYAHSVESAICNTQL